MCKKCLLLTVIVVLVLSCCACGSDIEGVPVKPNTEGSGSNNDDDNSDDNSDDNDEDDDGKTDEGDGNQGDDSTDESKYLVELSNGDFEQGMEGWSTHDYKNASQATVEIVEGMGVDGSKCVKISQKATNTVCSMAVERTLTGLKPETLYRMTAQVKYENVVKGCGAVIFNHSEIQYWNSSEYLLGTNMDDWTTAMVDFLTDQHGNAKICCALGYWLGGKQDGGRSTGTVYYDNVKVVEVSNQMYIRHGKHMSIYIDPSQIKIPDSSVDAWLKRVDDMYEAYTDLIGSTPYDGRRLGILTTNGMDKGYLALAGLPILWNGTKNYQRDSFNDIHQHESMDFGMMHEMGHCFNHIGESGWNWNDEMFANFRMQYGLEQTGYGVYTKGAKDSASKMYFGREILNMYKQDYEKTLATGINDNGIHYLLARMAGDDALGWDVYKKTFRYLHSVQYSGANNKWSRFQNFIDTLTRFAKEVHGGDVDAWDYLSDEEIASVKKSLNK